MDNDKTKNELLASLQAIYDSIPEAIQPGTITVHVSPLLPLPVYKTINCPYKGKIKVLDETKKTHAIKLGKVMQVSREYYDHVKKQVEESDPVVFMSNLNKKYGI